MGKYVNDKHDQPTVAKVHQAYVDDRSVVVKLRKNNNLNAYTTNAYMQRAHKIVKLSAFFRGDHTRDPGDGGKNYGHVSGLRSCDGSCSGFGRIHNFYVLDCGI